MAQPAPDEKVTDVRFNRTYVADLAIYTYL